MYTKKLIRSRAPLRIGLAGGGTDIYNFFSDYKGKVLNVTINLYANCTIENIEKTQVQLLSLDKNESYKIPIKEMEKINFSKNSNLSLIFYTIKKIINKFGIKLSEGIKITTYLEVPGGSGLGSSSTLVVAIIQALSNYYNLPLSKYEIANLAYSIERIDLKMLGGKQDQYAATFGGINFMEFLKDGNVIVNPLKLRNSIYNELESSIVLYYTGVSRNGSKIIENQIENINLKKSTTINSLKKMLIECEEFKQILLQEKLHKIPSVFKSSWSYKKKIAKNVSNAHMDNFITLCLKKGAYAAKWSGAGGGGFVIFYCNPSKKYKFLEFLSSCDGEIYNFSFTDRGCESWQI